MFWFSLIVGALIIPQFFYLLACVAGGIGDRVRVLCLWRMAERGNRGAARELEQAARELGRSRVEGISLAAALLADRGFAAHARGLRPLLSQLDSSPIPSRLAPIPSRLRGSLSAIRHKQSTRTRSPIPPATQAIYLPVLRG